MSLSLPKCDFCKYYHEKDDEKASCDAFPDGIPLEIMLKDEKEQCKDEYKYLDTDK